MSLRRLRTAGSASLALVSALAHAAPPAPAPAPAAPAVPALPALPTAPALPKLPTLPTIPGAPAGAAPAGAPAAAPAAPSAPGAMQPATDGAGTTVTSESSGDDDSTPRADLGKADENGLPNTLPKSIRRGAVTTTEDTEETAATLAIEDVSTAPISGAINRNEPTKLAPAWTIVFSSATLRARGYANLSELLDDLPSVDVSRSFGQSYANASFRGIRTGNGAAPYLIVVDGLPINNLFTGDANVLASMPISNVEQVEVSYGPSAAYFGTNAVMAVINVTSRRYFKRQSLGDYGATVDARNTYGGSSANMPYRALATKIVDVTAAYIGREFVFRSAVRIEDSAIDRGMRDGYAYLGDAYYSDPRLWGRRLFDAYPTTGGRFESPDNKHAADVRLEFKDLELGYQYYDRETGQGTASPGDRVQNAGTVLQVDQNMYLKHSLQLGRDAKAVTFVRHRTSTIDGNSSILLRRRGDTSASFDFTKSPFDGPTFYQFGQESASTGLQSDFTSVLARSLMLRKDELSLSAGIRYAAMRIASDLSTSNAIGFPIRPAAPNANDCLVVPYSAPTREQDAAQPPLPSAIPAGPNQEYIGCSTGGEPGAGALARDARATTLPDLFGTYISARYEFLGRHYVHTGLRLDGSTQPGSQVQVNGRFAYVGNFDPYVVKLLYGRATFEPSAFDRLADRFGTTTNTVAIPRALTSEHSQTVELQIDSGLEPIQFHAGGYFVHVTDPRSTFDDAKLTNRQVVGGDLSVRVSAGPVKGYAMVSRMFVAREWGSDAAGNAIERSLGDIATTKALVGTAYADGPFVASTQGRCMGARTTIPTNPIAEIPAYCVVDANVMLRNLPFQGLAYGIRTTNLLDAQYAQPGIGRADAGAGPGYFSPNGTYSGSLGMDSSLLPQPRRTILVTLSYEQ